MKSVKKKAPNKTSLLHFDKNIKSSPTKELSINIKNEDKEFHEMDSPVFLNDTKERKKCYEICERNNLLKADVNALLIDSKTDKNSDYYTHESSLFSNTSPLLDTKEDIENDIKSVENWEYFKKTSINENNFKPNYNSTPSKFSEWLEKAIDKLERKYDTKKSETNELFLNSALQMDLTPGKLVTNSFPTDFSSSNMSSLSQQKVEQLLYKSFLLQSSGACLSASEASGLELNKYSRKTEQVYRSRKSGKKFNKRGPLQGSIGTHGRFSQCGVKQRKVNRSSSHSKMEIITLDSSSDSHKLPGESVECVDLDVSSYDWSEPFVIDEDTEQHSDVQVLEDGGKKNENIKCKELTSNNSGALESDFSIDYDESEKPQRKKIWECPVCFERSKGQEVVATQCGHIFCRKCIERHISILNNCPSCRCDLKNKPLITLFNF